MDPHPTAVDGVTILRGQVVTDSRGTFHKTFHAPTFARLGLTTAWSETFWSASSRGVMRGLHFQVPPSDQAKAVTCVHGSVYDVALDLRRASSTYGRHVAIELRAGDGVVLHLTRGIAHGFQALTEGAVLSYAVETIHHREDDRGIRWDSCGIAWPLAVQTALVSPRDQGFPALADFPSPF